MVIFIGFLAIIGVIIMQLLLINKALKFEKKELESKLFFALQDVVERIYTDNKSNLTFNNQIKKVSDGYYIVNVDDVFENKILEHYLKIEFQKVNVDLDFEYSIYNCGSDKMVYGNYVSSTGKTSDKCEDCFSTNNEMIYYFAIRFPDINKTFYGNLQQYWIFTFVLFMVLIIYVYSVFTMLKQKRYTDLQKDFINNMTHEFKTPLSSILIASNFANTQNEIKDNPKLSKYIQIIINQSNKLNEHIEKILYVAKTDSKQIVLEKTSNDLKNIVDLVIENIELKHQKKINFKSEINQNYLINADDFHFYNIIYNVLDNAIKYAGKETEIVIKAIQEKHKLAIIFSDNGSGIPQVDLPFIFDKFYRVTRQDNKDIEGFGIGLSYVKRICDLHKWKVSLINNLDKGISVKILINKEDFNG
ncbi:HAMP domain-containing sensor histidine kinase [uncultured Flavobacterium sp.]|uniref:sensor histidine kinase n=1 Tax=uncultured Flavobacterium sp. TaxID=165435 RepID=UPI0030CA5980